MTTVTFLTEEARIIGFDAIGHSGYAEEGEDIVCAAVTSAVRLVDATINDRLTFLDYILQTPDAPIQVAAETDDPALMAFAFAKGNTELRNAVNAALEELREDGTLAEISMKYLGEDVSQ